MGIFVNTAVPAMSNLTSWFDPSESYTSGTDFTDIIGGNVGTIANDLTVSANELELNGSSTNGRINLSTTEFQNTYQSIWDIESYPYSGWTRKDFQVKGTIIAWVKIISNTNDSIDIFQRNASSQYTQGMRFRANGSTGVVTAYMENCGPSNGDISIASASGLVDSNTWTQIAFTQTQDGTREPDTSANPIYTFYKNGVAHSTYEWSGGSRTLDHGALFNGTTCRMFSHSSINAKFGPVYLYNTRLSAAQIKLNYNTQVSRFS